MTPDGLVTSSSALSPEETTTRLVDALTKRGVTILARIDHAAAAHKVGLDLRPTEVIIFGNPKAGTPLMQASQTIGIDLPLKALIWQDEHGQTWLSYNEPAWLAARHGLAGGSEQTVQAMRGMLAAVAEEATASSNSAAP